MIDTIRQKITPHHLWNTPDSSEYHRRLGFALVLLLAGCTAEKDHEDGTYTFYKIRYNGPTMFEEGEKDVHYFYLRSDT